MKTIIFYFLYGISLYTNAQSTNIPDPAFEQELINQGYDDVIDGLVLTNNINSIVDFTFQGSNSTPVLYSLEGIEDFTNLETLFLQDMYLVSTLNLTNNTNLKSLRIVSAPYLTEINLVNNLQLENISLRSCGFYNNGYLNLILNSNMPQLTGLYISECSLQSIDVSSFQNLEYLKLDTCCLDNLDITQNTQLKYLDIGNIGFDYACANTFNTIDLSQNTLLESFFSAYQTSLNSVDFSSNPNLKQISFYYSYNIEHISIKNGNNAILELLQTGLTPNLTCIEVDDAIYSEENWVGQGFNLDAEDYFSNDCTTVSIEDKTLQNITLYPNPTNNMLYIENTNNTDINHIKIFNLLGQQVLFKKDNFNQINLSFLKPALYLVTIKTDTQVITSKILKK